MIYSVYKNFSILLIAEEPVVFVRKLEDSYTGVEKQTVTMECEVNKDNVRCVWKKYGKVIDSDDKFVIESNGRVQKLTINNLTLQDKQNLSCVAIKGRNEDDELASTSTKIVIKGELIVLSSHLSIVRLQKLIDVCFFRRTIGTCQRT